MAEPDRREKGDEPNRDQNLKSLMEEYLASTREPVGSRDLFLETREQSEHTDRRQREASFDRISTESAAITVYLVCVAALLIAVLAIVFS